MKQQENRSMAAVYKSILQNEQQVNKIERASLLRDRRFQQNLRQSHSALGTYIFQERFQEYYDVKTQNKFKTRHLRLREEHRSLSGMVSKQQKERDRQKMLNPVENQLMTVEGLTSQKPERRAPVVFNDLRNNAIRIEQGENC
jgi:hypothetical protein